MSKKIFLRSLKYLTNQFSTKTGSTNPNAWSASVIDATDPVTASTIYEKIGENQSPIAEWTVPNHEVYDETTLVTNYGSNFYYVGLQAYHPTGILAVDFNVNNGGWIPALTDERTLPNTPKNDYFILIPESSIRTGLNEVRARIYPVFGTPIILQGRNFVNYENANGITYSQFGSYDNLSYTSLFFWKYGASAENIYVNLDSGNDSSGTGTSVAPYKSIEGAIYKKWESINFADGTTLQVFPNGAYINVSGGTSGVGYVGVIGYTASNLYPIIGFSGSVSSTVTNYIHPPVVIRGTSSTEKPWFYGVTGSSVSIGTSVDKNKITRPVLSSWRNFVFGPKGDINAYSNTNGATVAFFDNIPSQWNPNIRSVKNFLNCDFVNGGIKSGSDYIFKAFIAGSTFDVLTNGGHPTIIAGGTVSTEYYNKGDIVFDIGCTFSNSQTTLKLPNTFELAFTPSNASKLYKRDSIKNCNAYGPRVNIDSYLFKNYNFYIGFSDAVIKSGVMIDSTFTNFHKGAALGITGQGLTAARSLGITSASGSALGQNNYPSKWNYGVEPYILKPLANPTRATKYNITPTIISNVSVANTKNTGNLSFFGYVDDQIGSNYSTVSKGLTAYSKDGKTGASQISNYAFNDVSFISATSGKFVVNGISFINESSAPTKLRIGGSGVIYNNFYFNNVDGYIETPLLPVSTTVNNRNGMWMNSWYMNNCLEPVAGDGKLSNGTSVLKPGNPNVTAFISDNYSGYPSNKSFIIDNKLTSAVEYSPYLYNAANQLIDTVNITRYDSLKGATAFDTERSNMKWEILVNHDKDVLLGRGLNNQLFKDGKDDRDILVTDLYFNQLGYSGAYVGFILEPKFTVNDSYLEPGICGQFIPNLKKMEYLPTYSSHGTISYEWFKDGLPIRKNVDSLVSDSEQTLTAFGVSENEGPNVDEGFILEGDSSGTYGLYYGNTGLSDEFETGLTYQINASDVGSTITCKITYNHYDNREGIGEASVTVNDDNFLRYSLSGVDSRVWVSGYPRFGYIDGPDNDSSKIVGFGFGIDTSDIDTSSIVRSQSLQNSVYNPLYGIVARKSSNYDFKPANCNTDQNDISHNLFNDKFIFALRNEDTGEKIWWHNSSDAALANVNTNWETFKHSYFLGSNGDTAGFLVTSNFTNYTNSSGSEILAQVLNDFNTSGNNVSDANQDGIVNAEDIASTLLRQYQDSDKLIGIKAYGYDIVWNGSSNIDHTTDEHPIYDFLNRAASASQRVIFEASDDLNNISFLLPNQTGSPSGYEPQNYPILPAPSGVNYWVNPSSGNNSNAGLTSNAPVKTIGKALQLLHANTQWTSTKPGYIICQSGVYDFDTLGQTYYNGPSSIGNVLIPFGATATQGRAHRGSTTKQVNFVSESFLGAQLRGSRTLSNITGISLGIVDQGISAGSRTFAIPYIPSNIYLAGVTGVKASDINLFTSTFPQPYRKEDQQVYVPALSHYRNLEVAGISYQDYELNVSQFSVYYSKALPSGFSYGQFSINGITSPSSNFVSKPGYVAPVTGATIGYFVCDPAVSSNNALLTYNFFVNGVPNGATVTNYWNNVNLALYTSDNNIANVTVHSIDTGNKRIYVNQNPSTIETIRRLSIIGHPDHLGFTGGFAISGATMYVKPFDGLSASVLNSRIQILDTAFGLQHMQNFGFYGFDISEIGSAIKTAYLGSAGLGPATDGTIFKYNKVQDTDGAISLGTVYNSTIDSNLFNRVYYRPFNNTSKNANLKNNTFLHHKSHSGIFTTEGSINTNIEGNLLYSTGAIHGNGIAVYSNADNVIVRNNGIYGDVIVLAINHYGKTADEFICEDNVLVGSGGIDLRQNLNRLNFEHNTCGPIGQASRKIHDEAGYNWWGLFDQKFRYNVYQSMSGGLVTSNGWNPGGYEQDNPSWTYLYTPPCTIDERGYTAAIYYDYINNPGAFSPALASTAPGNVSGYTYNPNFTDYYMVGTLNQNGSYAYAHNCYVKPFDNPLGLPNNYKNMVIGSGTFPVETQPDSGTDIYKNPREITQNIFYCLNRLSGGSIPTNVDNITPALEYIYEDSENFNYKIKETAYAIPPTAQYFTSPFYSAVSNYDTLYANSRTQKINEYVDPNGDAPGVRWTSHPPADIYEWWLWQENVGFYAPPSES